MGLFVKKNSTTWTAVKKVYVKTTSTTWKAVKKIYVKTTSGSWAIFWPSAGPSTAYPPFFTSDSAGLNALSSPVYTASSSGGVVTGNSAYCWINPTLWDSNSSTATISSFTYTVYATPSSAIGSSGTYSVVSGPTTTIYASTPNYITINLANVNLPEGYSLYMEVTANRSDSVAGKSTSDEWYSAISLTRPTVVRRAPVQTVSSTINGQLSTNEVLTYNANWDTTFLNAPDNTLNSLAWYSSANSYTTIAQVLASATPIITGVTTNYYYLTGLMTSTLTLTPPTVATYYYAIDSEKNSYTTWNNNTPVYGLNASGNVPSILVQPAPAVVTAPTMIATTPSGYSGNANSFTVGATVSLNTGAWSPTPTGTNAVAWTPFWSTSSTVTYAAGQAYQNNQYKIYSGGTPPYTSLGGFDTTQNQNHTFTIPALVYQNSSDTAPVTSTGKYITSETVAQNGSSASQTFYYNTPQKVHDVPYATTATITYVSPNVADITFGSTGSYYYQLQYYLAGTWTNIGSAQYLTTLNSSGFTIRYTGLPNGFYLYRVASYNDDSVWIGGSSINYNSNPNYTFVFGNSIWVSTNGYLNFTNSDLTVSGFYGTNDKILSFLTTDMTQDSIKYASTYNANDATNYQLISWTGHRTAGGTANEANVQIWIPSNGTYAYLAYTFTPSTLNSTTIVTTGGSYPGYYAGLAISSSTQAMGSSTYPFSKINFLNVGHTFYGVLNQPVPFWSSTAAGWLASSPTGTADEGYTLLSTVAPAMMSAPTSIVAPTGANLTDTTATISWSAPTNNGGSNLVSYEYQVNGGTWTTSGFAGSIPNTSVSITNLTANTPYTVNVRASNASNIVSTNYATTTFTTASAPGPVSLNIFSFVSGAITAYYTTGTNTASVKINASYQSGSFTIYNPSANNSVNIASSTASSFSVTGQPSTSINTVTVIPYGVAGATGAFGGTVSSTITPTGQDNPIAAFASPSVTGTTITQSWTGSGAANRYDIDVKNSLGVSIGTNNGVTYPVTNSTATSISLTGLTAGSTYTIYVTPKYYYTAALTYLGAQINNSVVTISTFTINNVTDGSAIPATPSTPTITQGTGTASNWMLIDWVSTKPSNVDHYIEYFWGSAYNSTSTSVSPTTITTGTLINTYDISGISTTLGTNTYEDYWPIQGTATTASPFNIYVKAVGNNRAATVTWAAAPGAGSYKVNFTVAGITQTSASTTGTSFTYDMTTAAAGATFTLNNVTAFATTTGSGTSTNGTLPATTSVTPVVQTSAASGTGTGNFTYISPDYTYAASNTLYFETNGFISLGTVPPVNTLSALTSAISGRILSFLPFDLVQDSLYYGTSTASSVNYLNLLWRGHRFSGSTGANEVTVEIRLQEGSNIAYVNYSFPSGLSVSPNSIGYYYNGALRNTAGATGVGINSQVLINFNTTSPTTYAAGFLFTPKGTSWGGWILAGTTSVTGGTSDDGYTTLSIASPSAPSVPTSIVTPTGTNLTATSVYISWSAPISNGGSAISTYDYSLNGTTWTTTGATASVTLTTTGSTAYSFYVRANNYGGMVGTASTAISFTTPAASHTVTFNGNGSTGGSTTAQTASTATALTSNGFTKTNYSFSGWNTAANGTGTSYANGASYSFSADITLYAQWTIVSYTITYVGNSNTGGTAPTTPTSVNSGSTFIVPANTFTRTGYNTNGWSDGTNAYQAGATYPAVTANVTLTAQWALQVAVPANSIAPALSSGAYVTHAITCGTGTWSNSPTSYTYQWYNRLGAISGATTNSYSPTYTDVGGSIYCQVIAANAGGNGNAANSNFATVNIAGSLTIDGSLSPTYSWVNSVSYTGGWAWAQATTAPTPSFTNGGTSATVTWSGATSSGTQSSISLASAGRRIVIVAVVGPDANGQYCFATHNAVSLTPFTTTAG